MVIFEARAHHDVLVGLQLYVDQRDLELREIYLPLPPESEAAGLSVRDTPLVVSVHALLNCKAQV